MDKDRNRDRVTENSDRVTEGQGQRDMDRWIGQRQEQGQSDRVRCTGTKGYEQGRGGWIGTKIGRGTE